MIDAFESEFARRLTDKLVEEQKGRMIPILSGTLETYEVYKAKCAYLQALRNVREWMEEIRDQLSQPEDKPSHEPKPMRQTAGYSGV
jgi:hypothetical protein